MASDDEMIELPEGPLDPTLEELFDTETLQWVFVGGKGGVGKTTTACSAAIEFAKRREKVLILSTDPAHNLSDAYGQKFSNAPQLVNGFDNLYAMELDSNFHESMQFSLNEAGGGPGGSWQKLIPEIMSALPGIDEALGFAELMQSVQSMDYSVIVFDTAPTGHTLRLLTFPGIIDKALRKMATYREKVVGTLNMLNSFSGQKVDTDELQQKFDSIRVVTASIRKTFQDPTKTTFVCVCIPEFLSVYETERLVQELARQQIDCSNIVVNQVVFPAGEGQGLSSSQASEMVQALKGLDSPADGGQALQQLQKITEGVIVKLAHLESALNAKRRMQLKYLEQIRELYADFHVVFMPVQNEEVRGVEKLKGFAQLLLTEREFPPSPDSSLPPSSDFSPDGR